MFGVAGELWLLAYAWLVDRYTTKPGAGFFDFTPQNLKPVLRRLPSGEVDMAVRSMGHAQLAVMCLIVSRTFPLAGMGDVSHEIGVAVFRHIPLLLAEPDSFTLL